MAGCLLLSLLGCGAGTPEAPPTTPIPPAVSRAPAAPPVAGVTCSSEARPAAGALGAVALRGTADARPCASVTSRAGAPLDPELVEDDVRALWSRRLFEDVGAVLEEQDGGPGVLVFEVRELPRLERVEAVGLPPGVSAAEALAGKPERMDWSWLRSAAGRLRDELRWEGHRGASVEPRLRPVREGAVAVDLVVTPGPRWRVGAVRVEGLAQADEATVRRGLGTTPGQSAPDELLERDRLVLSAALYEVGLLEARVTSRVVDNPLASSFDVVFTVVEGPTYRLGKVRVTGPGALPPSRYEALLRPLPRGAVFARSKVASAREAVSELHRAEGAPREVEVETRLDAAKRVVEIDLVLR